MLKRLSILYFRGPPKKRLKKASSTNTVTSIVVATTGSGMVFPHNETVANATHKPKRVKKGTTKKGPPPTTSTSRLIFHFSITCHLQPTISLIFFFIQGLELDPMTPFLLFMKLSTLLLFMKKLHLMKSLHRHRQCIHQGRSKPS